MSKIANLNAREILDSRGDWTIEVAVETAGGIKAVASVPQGKSTGSREDVYVEPKVACENIRKEIAPALADLDVSEQSKIDELMLKLDGTKNESRLGANAILGVSIAVARAAALEVKVPFWQYLRGLYGEKVEAGKQPKLYINMINGGLHAGNNLDFQEYLVILGETEMKRTIASGVVIYHALEKILVADFGKGAGNVGDEGGFAPNFSDNLLPFEYLARAVKETGIQGTRFGMDAAASNIKKSADELFSIYLEAKKKFDLMYIEDPFGEDDDLNFTKITRAIGTNTIIAGDDLTTTSAESIKKFGKSGAINGVIIKPNQIGSLTEAMQAVRMARKCKIAVVVSHRSGETTDDFIADFAWAVGADGLKLGAPARGERIAKYDRLLEIEREVRI